MTIKFVQSSVSETAARKHFEGRRLGNLFGLLKRRPSVSGAGRPLPCLEQVWLPQYLIRIGVNAKRGPGEIAVSVEGFTGSFAVVDLQGEFSVGEVQGETFPPKLTEEEAIEIGRKELQRSIMKRRGQRHKPVVESAISVDLFHYPIWVYYYERRRGLIDLKVYDAATGEKTGTKTKLAVVEALAAASRRKRDALGGSL